MPLLSCCVCGFPSSSKRHQNQGAWRTPTNEYGKKLQIVFIGLDGSGKTSLLYALRHPPPRPDQPQADGALRAGRHSASAGDFSDAVWIEGNSHRGAKGQSAQAASELAELGNIAPPPNLKTVTIPLRVGGTELIAVDTAGCRAERDSWRSSVTGADAVVLVIDSSDALRLPVARHELWKLEGVLRDMPGPFLVLANKQDIRGAMNTDSVRDMLQLNELESVIGGSCATKPCTAVDRSTIEAAIDWLITVTVTASSCKDK
ncbi:hypothetical protein CYMTET_51136 [Cymbomonas tetramitiformis]|uniref:Uncharacterized protein n=1 Tax=Cymbomonas tetramitiformis TaxID=36881 RepID=A0AAE0BNM8_9CHLO|nr:hypothetical protein CYMTET_51136 [Cymbomonas tetramitiformis]